ncbi:DUF402 domain-containing protein [Lysinibacillus cavernae]|uniref:DUF402 domain-containing protein n=1 Tax=Lysinibacillus cavernae TaxID=2666135 RepID=UPI0012D8772C|nr:DUF402 domain-containing protein [Lysinibacillus cavernae]
MVKRRYLHRNDWDRIIKRSYREKELNDEQFVGYISLIQIHKVSQPLITKHLNREICIVDNNYSWLQQLPLNECFAITTMFNSEGEIIQWYIDITNENGIENNMPYMDDLFLDLIVFPTGEIIQKDKEELEEALKNKWITEQQYVLAYKTFNKVLEEIQNGNFKYLSMSLQHRSYLI